MWIGSSSWAISNQITSLPGIQEIGTIIGFIDKMDNLDLLTPYTQELLTKLSEERAKTPPQEKKPGNPDNPCPQCWNLSPANISLVTDSAVKRIAFSVYAAVYTAAQALHNMLKCTSNRCDWQSNTKIYPWKVIITLTHLKKNNGIFFMKLKETFLLHLVLQLLEVLRNTSVNINGTKLEFSEGGNPNIGYNVIQWHWRSSGVEFNVVGSYFQNQLFINESKLTWHTKKVT